jgi:hypothetical protein
MNRSSQHEQWENEVVDRFESYGDTALTVLLILAAIGIVFIALFVHSPVIKALALAYVVLP